MKNKNKKKLCIYIYNVREERVQRGQRGHLAVYGMCQPHLSIIRNRLVDMRKSTCRYCQIDLSMFGEQKSKEKNQILWAFEGNVL